MNEWEEASKSERVERSRHPAGTEPFCLVHQQEGPRSRKEGAITTKPPCWSLSQPSLAPPSPSLQNPATNPHFPPQSSSLLSLILIPHSSPHSQQITMFRTLASRIASPSKATFRAFHQNAPMKDQMSRTCSPSHQALVFNSYQNDIAKA